MSEMPTVTLSKIYHKKTHCIAIDFKYNQILIDLVKSIAGTHWSLSKKVWYIENNPDNLKLVLDNLKAHAFLDSKPLFNTSKVTKIEQEREVRILTTENKSLLNNFYKYLKGKRYSQSTVATYTFLTADFIAFHNEKHTETLTSRDVEIFIESVYIRRNYSVSTQRQFISAMKLFTVFYPNTKINNLQLERPKSSKMLPSVLSANEIVSLISVTKNLKHRAILALLYSAGLRISELIQLELNHINIDRKQIIVKNAKGRKDRYVVLADSFMPMLKNYYLTYKPKRYFVEGPNETMYSASSVRKFLAKSCEAANIYKNVTPHTLRHSYATHLLEQGINLRHIQELLGHCKPETTMIYTHVARKDLLEIKSPLDMAVLTHKKTDNDEQKFLLSGK